ncbi:MAG: hypothetical protein A2341_01305 [Deltaproteobacteria bacterium RIFOXYB12_FULL_58_9]|nr:MAG: hypothetical protein A2341_01305 [Deltaproteobacteria bacterium RIFOXYB12_FULL_58_9]
MGKRWPLIALAILVLASAASTVWLVGDTAHELQAVTVSLADLDAELFHLDASSITRRGPPRVWVLRFNSRIEAIPYHYESSSLDGPQSIEAWQKTTGAMVVINAGQFDEELNYLGWLKADGKWLSPHQHHSWMGLLVSGPIRGHPWAGVIDLKQANPNVVENYRHVVQSMMLLDDQAQPRVRDSDRSACRTIIAQDQDGRILFMVSEGAVTLADLARWLLTTGLGISRAMNMDGGIESQLAIHTSELELSLYGQYGTGTAVFDAGAGQIRYPLPAVIAVRRAKQ